MQTRLRGVKQTNGRGLSALAGAATFIATFIAACVLASGARAAVPVVVLGELHGATGVNVDGVVYDVTFAEGSCVGLYDGCDDVSDLPFATLGEAVLGSQALLDQVFKDSALGSFDTVPSLITGCTGVDFCGAATPFGVPDATDVGLTSAVNFVAESSDTAISGTTARIYDSAVDTFHALTTYTLWTPVPPATPVVELGKLKGALGVNVDGVLYDVEFVEGSCIDIYAGCDDASDFPFASLATALLAGQALQDQVILDGGAGNFDTTPNLTFGCSGTFCGTAFPYGVPGATDFPAVSAVNFVAEASDAVGAGTTARTFDSAVDSLHGLTTWAVWTPVAGPAVPVLGPLGYGLLTFLLASAPWIARRRG